MTAVVAVLVVVALIVLLVQWERNSDLGDGERRVEPLHGDAVRSAPDGWVVVARGMPAAEAQVVRGLLDSNGIRVAVDASGPHLAGHPGQPPGPATSFTLSVAPEDADVARDLLNG